MDLFSLKDKVIVITGSSGLLGRQHADAVCMAGGIPVLIDLNQKVLNNQAKELNIKFGISVKGYVVDITVEERVMKNSIDIIKEFGKIDGLVILGMMI